jgi:4-hydroxy-tetrahydrodipicolinate synthase
MVATFRAGKLSAALKMHQQLYPLFKDLFIETNPQPIKAALAMMGLIQEEFRLPLVPMSAKNRAILKSTLLECGVLRHD